MFLSQAAGPPTASASKSGEHFDLAAVCGRSDRSSSRSLFARHSGAATTDQADHRGSRPRLNRSSTTFVGVIGNVTQDHAHKLGDKVLFIVSTTWREARATIAVLQRTSQRPCPTPRGCALLRSPQIGPSRFPQRTRHAGKPTVYSGVSRVKSAWRSIAGHCRSLTVRWRRAVGLLGTH